MQGAGARVYMLAYIREDFWDALAAIATAAHWQRVALVGLVCVGGCLGMLGGLVALGFVWGTWDYWQHRADAGATPEGGG
jgi:hypothetical protein